MGRLSEAFERDHQRWEQVLSDVERCVAAGAWAPARARFAAFREGIQQHMAVEERWLFPAFEAEAGEAGRALTETLRKGHRDLRLFFEELQDAMAAQDEEEFHQITTTMRALLHLHDAREEAELYPAAELRLGEEGAAAATRLAGGASEGRG